jgi:hypothetical protein
MIRIVLVGLASALLTSAHYDAASQPANPDTEWAEAVGHAKSCVAGVLEQLLLSKSSKDDAVKAAGICGAPLYRLSGKLGITQAQARAVLDDLIRQELSISLRN